MQKGSPSSISGALLQCPKRGDSGARELKVILAADEHVCSLGERPKEVFGPELLGSSQGLLEVYASETKKSHKPEPATHTYGCGSKIRARVMQVKVVASMYQGAISGTFALEPYIVLIRCFSAICSRPANSSWVPCQ